MKFPLPALLLLLPLQPLAAQEAMPAEAPAAEPASGPPPAEAAPSASPETPPSAEASPDSAPAAAAPAPAAPEIPAPAEAVPASDAAGNAEAEDNPALKLARSLNYQSGDISVKGGLVSLKLPETLRYLDPKDTQTMLVELWGNPDGSDTLGAILPANTTPLDPESWAVILTYEEDGHVSDKDADKIDYDDLLKDMQKATQKANKAREKDGFSTLELVGWAVPPRYDREAHQLYWAKELKFSDSEDNTLNYNLRLLGRRGVLNLNVVAGMKQLSRIEAAIPGLLQTASFTEGNRYADFNPASDKLAEYGLAALVTGGLLAAGKGGLFKILLAGLLAFKKVIVVAVVAGGSLVAKLFKRSKSNSA
jgi:uncharacterized membrane-anchored protein